MSENANRQVDSWRFTSGVTLRMLKHWVTMEAPDGIPWTALRRPVAESTVALLSSAAISHNSQPPFDEDGERANPWWGDPGYRKLPNDIRSDDVYVAHLHINREPMRQDLDCALPVQRLRELAEAGEVGAVADHHYAYMGYQLDPTALMNESVPQIIEDLRKDGVDLLVLVPV